MKAITSLFATSALFVVGTVNATTVATYDVSNSGTITGGTTGIVNETGTAVLDIVGDSGTLSINMDGLTNSASAGSFTLQSLLVFTGTYSAGILTITGGTRTNLDCQPGTSSCSPFLQLGVTNLLSDTPTTGNGGGLPLTITLHGISYDNLFHGTDATENMFTSVWEFDRLVNTASRMTFTNTTPSVPVPAAAWLFGSGLLGLTGMARRRKAA